MKIKVEIDVPDSWVEDYLDNSKKDIMQRWGVVKYFTGHKAEYWVINNSLDSIDGRIEFYEAVRAVEDSILSILERKSKGDI